MPGVPVTLPVMEPSGASVSPGGIVPESSFNARSFVELVGEVTLSMMTGIMGAEPAKQYFPLIGTMAFFILVSNLLGQVPGFGAPTGNFNTTGKVCYKTYKSMEESVHDQVYYLNTSFAAPYLEAFRARRWAIRRCWSSRPTTGWPSTG